MKGEYQTMNEVKTFIVAVISGMFALLLPIKDFMHAMILLFIVNFLCGLLADFRQGHHWSMKKAMVFFYHVAIFFIIAVCAFMIGHFMHNENEALYCIKTLCLIALWFYVVNILRNIKEMLVKGTTMYAMIEFLHYVVSLKLVNSVPFLNDYLMKREKQGTDNTEVETNDFNNL